MNQHPRGLRVLAAAIAAAGLTSTAGCAKRLQLTPAEFQRVAEREQATEDLRVYVSKKLIVHYELADDSAIYTVDKTITASSEQNLVRLVLAKSTKGLVIGSEDRNGAPLLWVTFDARCRAPGCAFGFVQTEDGAFRLVDAPIRDGYAEPEVFYKRDAKPMSLAKLASLAEKNQVYAWKNPRAKVFTIDLVVKKRSATKQRVETERGSGID